MFVRTLSWLTNGWPSISISLTIRGGTGPNLDAKWVSMLDLKAGFHNIRFEATSSYDSTFVTHRGKFRWLRMPMGLT